MPVLILLVIWEQAGGEFMRWRQEAKSRRGCTDYNVRAITNQPGVNRFQGDFSYPI